MSKSFAFDRVDKSTRASEGRVLLFVSANPEAVIGLAKCTVEGEGKGSDEIRPQCCRRSQFRNVDVHGDEVLKATANAEWVYMFTSEILRDLGTAFCRIAMTL